MTDNWTPWIPLNIPRANHACTDVKDKSGKIEKIMVAGGIGNMNAESPLDNTEIYIPKHTSWKMGSSLPQPTTGASLVHVEKPLPSRILLIGGCQYNPNGKRESDCSEVYALNENSSNWINVGKLKKSRIDSVSLLIAKDVDLQCKNTI